MHGEEGRWGTGKDADHPARALQLCAVEGGGRRPRGAAGARWNCTGRK